MEQSRPGSSPRLELGVLEPNQHPPAFLRFPESQILPGDLHHQRASIQSLSQSQGCRKAR